MDYQTFQTNYKSLTENNATSDDLFDLFLIPFVTSLHYQTALSLGKHNPGEMLIKHNDHQRIIAFPDQYSKIIFEINADINKIAYDAYTLIVNLNDQQDEINLIIPYFGKYVISETAKFYNDLSEYKTLLTMIDFQSRSKLNEDNKKKLFYQLATIYDLSHKQEVSQLLINEVNTLIKNKDPKFIQLLVKNISDKSDLKEKIISNKIENYLNQQTANKYYYFEFIDKDQIKHTEVLNIKEQSKSSNTVNKEHQQDNSQNDNPLLNLSKLASTNNDNAQNDDSNKGGEKHDYSGLFESR